MQASGFCMMRVGTCGGVGCAPGTIVVTSAAVDPEVRGGFCIGIKLNHSSIAAWL